jgi:hypothetical protein
MKPEGLIKAYLRQLKTESGDLPRQQRRELLADIREHIQSSLPAGPDRDANSVREVLRRLGEPREIVAAARAAQPESASPPRGQWGPLGIVLLVQFGGLLWGVGWLTGVLLLWTSRTWRVRDKIIGTVLVPGGLALPIFLTFKPESCTVTSTSGPLVEEQCGQIVTEPGLDLFLLIGLWLISAGAALWLIRSGRAQVSH